MTNHHAWRHYCLPAAQGNATPTRYLLAAPSTQPKNEIIIVPDEVEQENERKRISWSIHDNKVLADAWLSISKCHGGGKSKNRKCFWKQVTDCYNENRESGPSREHNAVKAHWHSVNRMVSAFDQCYNEVVSVHGREWNDDQVKQRAREFFYESYCRHFVHEYLWVLLKDDSNWKGVTCAQLSAKKLRTDGNGGESASGVTSMQISAKRPRTDGNGESASGATSLQYAAKKLRTEGNGECASSSGQDSRAIISNSESGTPHTGQKAIKQEKEGGESNGSDGEKNHQAMEKKSDDGKRKALKSIASTVDSHTFRSDYEILVRDTTGMNEQQLAAHLHMCSILKAKYNFP